MSKAEEIARETLVACDIEDDHKVYGRHDLYNAKDVIESAVNVALEWAAQQCDNYGSVHDALDLFTKTSVAGNCADRIRAGKSA